MDLAWIVGDQFVSQSNKRRGTCVVRVIAGAKAVDGYEGAEGHILLPSCYGRRRNGTSKDWVTLLNAFLNALPRLRRFIVDAEPSYRRISKANFQKTLLSLFGAPVWSVSSIKEESTERA